MAEYRWVNLGKLVWRGIRKKPLRSFGVLICFTLIAASLFSAVSLLGGTAESLHIGISRMGSDLLVVPEGDDTRGETMILRGHPSTFAFPDSKLEKIAEIDGVEQVCPQLYIASLQASCCSLPVQLIGFDPDRDFTIIPWLASGDRHPLGKDEIFVGARISGDIGSPLMFYGHTFTIAGRLEPTGMGLDTSVFMRLEDVYQMAEESGSKAVQQINLQQGQVSSILVKVRHGAEPNLVAALIQAQVPGTRVITPSTLISRVTDQLSDTLDQIYLVTGLLVLISLPVVGIIAYHAALERRRELGLIIAMGGSAIFVFVIVIAETLLLAAAGGLIGIAAASLILYSYQDLIALSLEVPFLWPSFFRISVSIMIPLLLAIVIGVAAGLYPALWSSAVDPYDEIWRENR
ncbi:MAG: ABC transporter permease [Methanomicrobiales archaeon]|nr:ABC transporter permease [Methanomicrobiales archaeon]